MKNVNLILLLLFSLNGFSQILPTERSVNWTIAGLKDTTTNGFIEIDMQTKGAIGNGIYPNDTVIDSVLTNITSVGAILKFPAGNYLFNKPINLQENIIIRGAGPENTIFTMNLNETGNSFNIEGELITSDTTQIVETAKKDSSFIFVYEANNFDIGDWIRIIQNDSNLVSSTWAFNTINQIVRIENILDNKIILESPLRMNFDINRTPYIMKIIPIKNVGIECIKIKRIDDTSPLQMSNINFIYAVNSWVNGVESENCTFSHVEGSFSSNLSISNSYFHHAFGYGDGGRAYGVMLKSASNECLVENNIFEHLRHSMIVMSGANGNVFTYNYSFDTYWNLTPNNSAGDIVLHGNYPYSNLFEQNICQNIVIDNSHGPNGPYNTFFRNRSERYGIFFSSNNSPSQNFIGNEIPNTSLPYSIANYTILGNNHFIHGNNNKGTIDPAGTNVLDDFSYAYTNKPDFVPSSQWAGIGTPNTMETNNIPAYDRYISGNIFNNFCTETTSSYNNALNQDNVIIYPNPMQYEVKIKSSDFIQNIRIINSMGQTLYYYENIGLSKHINTSTWKEGVYLFLINFSNKKHVEKIVIKST